MLILEVIFFFILGTIFGSFYNVVIYRLPRKESIVVGSSHCTNCNTPIKPYDLIPILSYVLLQGKCRQCKHPISSRYASIELLTGITFALTYMRFNFSYETLVGLLLSSILIIIAMIDIDTLEIYDRFQVFLLVLAIPYILWISPYHFITHIIGFFIISVPFYIIALITNGIGGGDIKLIAMAGLLLGWQNTLVTFLLSSILGGIVAIILVATKQQDRKSLIAFGPYLCIGIFISYLYGPQLIKWYINLIT